MKLSPLIFSASLIACCPSSAADKDQRFVELPGPSGKTNTYDLSTVQMIQPGRFTIISTSIDDADVMKLELKVLDTLRTYCNHPDGKYPAPTDLFTLGPPDMPIRSIEVTSSQTQLAGRNYPFKMVSWPYPYTRLATQIRGELSPAQGFLHCRQWSESEEKLYAETRALIMNGIRSKELFDCKRGLSGVFIHEDDDPSKAITGVVRPQSYNGQYYRSICLRVMQETPYSPE